MWDLFKVIFWVIGILGIVIFMISVTLVSNTMRLIIHSKQDSIETLHLLGATNGFIRFPLVIEGIIQGLCGAGFSLFFLRGVAPKNVKTINIYRGVVPFIFIQVIAIILLFIFPQIATWLPRLIN